MRKRNSRHRKRTQPQPKKRPVPVRNDKKCKSLDRIAEFIDFITFQWISPLMTKAGSFKPALPDSKRIGADHNIDQMCRNFDSILLRYVARGDQYPLLWTLWDILWSDIWIGGICQLMSALLQLLVPFLTKYLMACISGASKGLDKRQMETTIQGFGFVIGIACAQLGQTIIASQFLFRGQSLSCHIRAILTNQVLSKALRMSKGPRVYSGMAPESARKTTELTEDMASDRGWSNSRLFTLITSDVTRIQAVWEMVHLLWTAPISIGVALLTLSFNIGKSAIWGCIIIVLGMIVITSAVRGMAKEQKLVTKLTDQRSSMAREVSRSIHVLKLFGWESKFLARFRCIRTQETRRIREIHSTHTWIQALWASLPTFATMGSLIAYSMSTDKFEPMAIFSTLATFNALRPLLNMLPLVIGQVLQSLEALAKVEKFLLENEPDDYIQSTPKANLAIRLDHATLGWYKPSTSDLDKGNEIHQNPVSKIAASSFLLSDLSLTVRPNEMLAVIGLTGSGKSSFLAALAGDMNLVEGVVQVNGTRAFCPQHAWMQNSSIRDNILFGREYNAARYHEVLRCCALKADIEKLADGDSTEVGDRGASLSGGQKARISLARAVYARTDIVIMDDPVASIDSNVGHHIMENVLCGLLKNCCRIVATHSPSILHRCDRILIIEDGRIKAIDTFDRLIRQGVLRNGFFSSPSENAITHNGPRKCDGRKSVRDKVKSRKAELHTKFVPPADVSWNGWKTYLSAGGTHLNCLAIIFLSILGNGMSLICSSWLSYWTSGKHLDMSNKKCAAVYAFLSVTQAILLACSTLCMMARGITASKELLQQVMMRIVRAPMSFYETGCLGTVIQQITVETGILDVHLTNCIRLFSMKAITTSLVVAVTVYHCHYFVLAVGPLIYLFLHVARRYRATAGKLHQHKSKRQSKLHAGLSETISGLSCIRGYGAWNHFKENIHSDIYAMNEIHLLSAACPRWLTIRLDAIGIALTSLVGVLGVVPWSGVSPSVFGMLFTNMLSISQTLQLAMRNMNEVMNGLRVVEGIVYYKTNIPQEASLGAEESQSMPNDEMCQQPQAGRISFLNASMRYRPGLPLALTDVNIDIQNGEMIAILGRTGAGKSSIIAALLRMTELSGGAIEIDGTDIAAMRLHDLRSAVAVIPQDVALFAGSIRSNVDPFHEYEDMRIYNVLKKVGLVHDQGSLCKEQEGHGLDCFDGAMDQALSSPVQEEGANLSLGNQQRIALARALLRDARIIVCDEATSAVDLEMDKRMQQTIAQVFHQKTILYITHRVRTVFRCDRVCVMGQSRILETGRPVQLWGRTDGPFRSMCDRDGMTKEDVDRESLLRDRFCDRTVDRHDILKE